jgi:DNA-directed RNA polymerase subunit RPC12/RpoP
MLVSECSRDDCLIGQRRISYEKLQREYRCNRCGGRLTVKWIPQFGSWSIVCALCGGQDFIHEYEMQKQESDAIEIIAGLPPELAALVNKKEMN